MRSIERKKLAELCRIVGGGCQDVPDKWETNLYKNGIFVYNVRIFQGDKK